MDSHSASKASASPQEVKQEEIDMKNPIKNNWTSGSAVPVPLEAGREIGASVVQGPPDSVTLDVEAEEARGDGAEKGLQQDIPKILIEHSECESKKASPPVPVVTLHLESEKWKCERKKQPHPPQLLEAKSKMGIMADHLVSGSPPPRSFASFRKTPWSQNYGFIEDEGSLEEVELVVPNQSLSGENGDDGESDGDMGEGKLYDDDLGHRTNGPPTPMSSTNIDESHEEDVEVEGTTADAEQEAGGAKGGRDTGYSSNLFVQEDETIEKDLQGSLFVYNCVLCAGNIFATIPFPLWHEGMQQLNSNLKKAFSIIYQVHTKPSVFFQLSSYAPGRIGIVVLHYSSPA